MEFVFKALQNILKKRMCVCVREKNRHNIKQLFTHYSQDAERFFLFVLELSRSHKQQQTRLKQPDLDTASQQGPKSSKPLPLHPQGFPKSIQPFIHLGGGFSIITLHCHLTCFFTAAICLTADISSLLNWHFCNYSFCFLPERSGNF